MSQPLQQTGYRASEYERPNDRFHCGRLAEGKPCAFGPSSKGVCSSVCTPRTLESGGAECGRPSSHTCGSGPVKDRKGRYRCSQVACQPRPTLRRLRGLVSLAAVILTVGLLALVLSHPEARDEFISPGELSLHHSALGCVDCHAAAVTSDSQPWTSAALKQEHLTAQIDAQKCSKCHKLEGSGWKHAHSMPLEQLQGFQERARARWSASEERPQPGLVLKGSRLLAQGYGTHDADGFVAKQQLECSSCHKEHQGRQVSLQVVPEHRCHVCHTVAFEAFEDGHPEFNSFGRRELPGNSIFTHWRHYELRFKEGQKLDCMECHAADEQGRHMVLKPKVFEVVCARCHQHRDNLAPLDVVSLPPGPAIGWLKDLTKRPEGLDEIPESKVTEMMTLLLPDVDHKQGGKAWKGLRKRYRSLMKKAPDDDDEDGKFSLGDETLRKKDLTRLKKAKKYIKPAQTHVAAIEALVAALAKGDMTPIRAGLELDANVDLSKLSRMLPPKAFQTFQEAWWNPEGSESSRELVLDPPPNLGKEWLGAGRWVASDTHVGLRYQGYSHVDPFLRAWLDLVPHMKPGRPRDRLVKVMAERCGKCHYDATRPVGQQVQWEALPEPKTRRRLTHFAHEPHLEVSPDCRGCHTFPKEEPPRSASDFVIALDWRTIGKAGEAGCLKCHTKERYGASCQLCHDYHAASINPATGTLPLRLMQKE